MKLKEILDKTTAFFKDKNIETPRLDAELLLAYGLGLERIQIYLRYDQPMKEDELVVLRDLVRRRGAGEPVAYILGYRDFFKSRFEVNPSVLIPRPETEHVVEEVLRWSKERPQQLGVVDLGCGSGCIGLSLLRELPEARLVAVDISEQALEVATRNAQTLGVSDRVVFLRADAGDVSLVMSAYRQLMGHSQIDALVSNPPYIASSDPHVEASVKKFEPHIALFADDEGLALLRAWSSGYAGHLRSPGMICMEMGMSQGVAMAEHLSTLKIFNQINVIKDLSGHDRVICGVKNG